MRYSIELLCRDIAVLAEQFISRPEAIVAIARGGLIPAQLLAYRLDIRPLVSIRAIGYDGQTQRDDLILGPMPDLDRFTSVLLVDDIVDSGRTMATVTDRITTQYPQTTVATLALFAKHTSPFQPDYYAREATEWVTFFWDQDCHK